MTGLPAVFALGGALRRYDWGSPTAIPHLLGEAADGRPAAELWFGAHAGDPSPALGTTLDRLIDAHPAAVLGPRVVERYGAQLPFLVKLLAVEHALSLQVHPSAVQARAGYAREQAAGVPLDAPQRTYKDRNHKPELICALTAFTALCGFRPVAATVALLESLGWAELAPLISTLRGTDPLRTAVTRLLVDPDPALARALTRRLSDWRGTELRGAALVAADFPDDGGLPIALLLNEVVLEPGQAIFLPAGNMHVYLRGLGVEVMANSDNVLRCGLTAKHVDSDALLSVTDFAELTDPLVPVRQAGPGTVDYPVPVSDFRLRRTRTGPAPVTVATGEHDAPLLVLCASGDVRVTVGSASAELRAGRAAFVPPGGAAAQLSGGGEAFLATCAV